MNHHDIDASHRKHFLSRKLFSFLRIPVLLIAIYLITGMVASRHLEVNHYTIQSDQINNPVRIVHLSDLHSCEFGPDNHELVDLVEAQHPDLILTTGDMINRSDKDLSVACSFLRQITEIAPVYYGFGNHEIDYQQIAETNLSPVVNATSVHVLLFEHTNIEVNGNNLCIGGSCFDYRRWEKQFWKDRVIEIGDDFADSFESTPGYHILLSHDPTAFVEDGGIDEFDVELSLSGHFHGGVFRIPIIDRGVYVPTIGLFPAHTKGVTTGKKGSCIQSAGLGNEHMIPRVFNPPEIGVIDLVPSAGTSN